MSIQSKFDDWITAGNNWRFIALVGGIALIVTALVFGSMIKKRTSVMLAKSQVSKIAAYPVATIPDTVNIPAALEPEPASAPDIWAKQVMCDKIGCWDVKTDRRLYLGKPR